MAPNFEYRPRIRCVCGNVLGSIQHAVEKSTAFGNVYFVRCPACGSYSQSPQITTESLTKWYDSDEYRGGSGRSGSAYVNYEHDEQARVHEARGRFRRHIDPFLPNNARVLEIGCATGSLLSVIRENGHSTVGIDLSPRFAEAARRIHGLDVIAGDFMALELEPASFNAIILLGTAPNMQDFPAAMERIHGLLKNNGFVLFNFPHADSWVASLYGLRYWMFAPSVSNFMTVQGCMRMLEQADFAVVNITTDTQQPSLGKLLHHSRLDRFVPQRWTNFTNHPIPLPLPIPAVKLVRASKGQNRTPACS